MSAACLDWHIERGCGEDSPASAILDADFGDGSTLTVTMMSDTGNDEVQVDIVSDGAALSFTDEYTFEAHAHACMSS